MTKHNIAAKALQNSLWKIYRRPEQPRPSLAERNRSWRDSTFSERVLYEHLDDEHGAASRPSPEQRTQVAWLWQKLNLSAGKHLFDVTCGPGLYTLKFARRGCRVTGLDFSPTSIAYAVNLAKTEGLTEQCHFVEQDILSMDFSMADFDAAILLYAQLESFDRKQAQQILNKLAVALKPGGTLCLELLNPEHVDKEDSSWWFTDEQGIWADVPFLHLGERFWYEEERLAVERYQIVHLETGHRDEIFLYNQIYSPPEMITMLKTAGFQTVTVYPAWDGLPLSDAEEWLVYIATK